jgi:thiamine-phosphate pyrophosphorylase
MDSDTIIFNRQHTSLYCFADSLSLCQKLLDAGARIIQLRAKNLNDDEFRKLVIKMQAMIRTYPAPATFIVNDRVNIALEIGADGFHVGQEDFDYRQAIKMSPSKMVSGVSVKSVDQALEAQNAGATYLGAGAIFPTNTKTDTRVIGLDELRRIVTATKIPVVAIGGLTLNNIDQVLRTGAHYFAIISDINNSTNIRERIYSFNEKLNKNSTMIPGGKGRCS